MSQEGDAMQLHQVLKDPDRDKLLSAMAKEVMNHEQRKH